MKNFVVVVVIRSYVLSNKVITSQVWRNRGGGGARGVHPPSPSPQIFKEQLTLSISTKGRRLCQTLYCSTPQIFRPSAIPASCLSSLAILHRFPSYQLRIDTSSFFEYFLKEHVLVVLDKFFFVLSSTYNKYNCLLALQISNKRVLPNSHHPKLCLSKNNLI